MSSNKKKIGLTGSRRRFCRKSLFRDQSGASAVEFALVAPIFLAFMFSLFEIGWYYYVRSIVDSATLDAARLIETGQIQNLSGSAAQQEQAVFTAVCRILKSFGDCDERLTVDIRVFPDFAALALANENETPTCADATQSQINNIPFQPGNDLQIVRMRVCFLYTPVNPIIGLSLREEGSTFRRLVSLAMFCNEPYSVNTSQGGALPANNCA